MNGVLEERYWSQRYAPVIRPGTNLTLASADKIKRRTPNGFSVARPGNIFQFKNRRYLSHGVKPTSLARIASLSWLKHYTLEGETQGHLNLTWAADGLVYDP
jgi:hypothetical protein